MTEISSVNEFIAAVETSKFLSWFRGESRNFGDSKITASAFRGKGFDFESACQEFYNEVSHKLTQDEKDNFLAFCQHHGIPTNLIDITSNPLVALWFACEENPKKDGYVYGFGNFYVNVTEFVKNVGIKIFPMRISRDSRESRKIFVDSFAAALKKSGYYSQDAKRFYKFYRHYMLDDICLDHGVCSECSCSREQIEWCSENCYDNLHSAIAFGALFDTHKYVEREIIKDTLWSEKIKHMPPMLYKPISGFNRFVNQKSAFFYQFANLHYIINGECTGKTQIKPIRTIKVPASAKSKILHTLDTLSINRKTVYSDYDSIAKYIVGKRK